MKLRILWIVCHFLMTGLFWLAWFVVCVVYFCNGEYLYSFLGYFLCVTLTIIELGIIEDFKNG